MNSSIQQTGEYYQEKEPYTPQPEKVKVLIAENQYLVTESLKVVLNPNNFVICQISGSWSALEEYLATDTVDIIITDHALLQTTTYCELSGLKQNYPRTSILILTNQINHDELKSLVQAGIKNIIYKSADRDELLDAIDATIKGKKYFSSEILELLMELGERKKYSSDKIHVTKTEREVITLITQGLSTKEIAEQKNISFHTVMTHRKNVFRKLNIKSASELFQYALKAGMIDPV